MAQQTLERRMNNQQLKTWTAALAAGALFAAGLVVSGMTQPAVVQGFLNIAGLFDPLRYGAWNPTLAFVMGSAVLVSSLAFAITPRAGKKPWFTARFELPTRTDLDRRLVLGATLFGVGWGIAGYCPGPAFAAVLTGGQDLLTFFIPMLVGMWLTRRFLT
jgi:hypothetical protein